jgi:hypothetical protein
MQRTDRTPVGPHGAKDLPSVIVDSYNLEMRTREGFLGDRASKGAFAEIVADWRERLGRIGPDPLGDLPASALTKPKLEKLLADGDPEQAGLVHGAIEDFSNELAAVVRRFLRTEGWTGTERIAIGGGMRESRIGELIIGRTAVLLKSEGCAIDLTPIKQAPDDAGLIGAVQLTPAWTLKGHDALLAVDIGGTNMRAGVVVTGNNSAKFFPKASVWKSKLWRHADRAPTRDEAVDRLVDSLKTLASQAREEKLVLAPFIGVGCPGVIEADGSIDRGGQNLPGGDWESGDFNLASRLVEALPEIGGEKTSVLVHNDAVVQGLSQRPFMSDVGKWGILTIGTGLGNARFTNKSN